jgi:hypothetical protein
MAVSATTEAPADLSRIVCCRFFSIDREGKKANQEDDLFLRNQLYYARPSEFAARDPNEFEFALTSSSLRDGFLHDYGFAIAAPPGDLVADRDLSHALYVEHRKTLDAHVRVCCFSNDGGSLHLWKDFARDFEGYMVAFKVLSFQRVASRPTLVTYTDDVPLLNSTTAFQGREDFMRVVFRKAERYRPEHEHRSIVWDKGGNQGLIQFPDNAIAVVIFGHRMHADERKRIEALIDGGQRHLHLFQTGWSEGDNQVKIAHLREAGKEANMRY